MYPTPMLDSFQRVALDRRGDGRSIQRPTLSLQYPRVSPLLDAYESPQRLCRFGGDPIHCCMQQFELTGAYFIV